MKYVAWGLLLFSLSGCTTVPSVNLHRLQHQMDQVELENKIRDAAMMEMIDILKRHEEKLKNYPL